MANVLLNRAKVSTSTDLDGPTGRTQHRFVNQAGNVQRQLIVNGEVLGRFGVGVDKVTPWTTDATLRYAFPHHHGGGTATVYITHQMESFNAAYVSSMAAHAGLKTATTAIDDDSVDLMLVGSGFTGLYRNPQLHLQLKATTSPKFIGGELKFALKIKNYNDLRDSDVLSPQYLVIMVMPSPVDDWLVHGPDSMTLHNCCYWVSLRGAAETENESNVTVD